METIQTPTPIFLVEDDTKLTGLIKEYLERHGFQVAIESDGRMAVPRILKENPALVVLDIMLPGKDGRTICRELRTIYDGPILILSALDEQIDQIVGLEIGADEYITKPVEPPLLLSKINALLRFAARTLTDTSKKGASFASEISAEMIVVGKLEIHAPSRTVLKSGQHLKITSAQFDLLVYLARNAGKVISRDRLFQQLRGIKYDGANRSIDSMVVKLREKIGDSGKHPHVIKSVRGEGYLMVKPL